MQSPTNSTNLVPVNIEDEMRTSYLDYAMSVIIGRALPDVRDGFKPVHRRVLYAMFREGLLHNRKFSKCAGVVGEVLKKYHPHGDGAVYDTLVRMAQPWNMRYPLVWGQGNFGSVDGDSAAAYRYTECKMQRLAEFMLKDIDKKTVDFQENYDGTTQEPMVLPTRFPTLLVNGSDGIAVGMATKIPPHNLREVINACILLIEHPETTIREIVTGREEFGIEGEEGYLPAMDPVIPGPDFPTGGFVYGKTNLLKAYETGRGSIQMRAKTRIEEMENSGRERIVVDELPYQVNKARLVEKIADLVRDRKVEGISDLRDESNREGMRIVIELKKEAYSEVVLNQLFKHSPLQSSFGFNVLAIDQSRPRLLNLKEMLNLFIRHRREVTTRRCRFELAQAEARAHILEGLKKALDIMDDVIATIRAAQTTAQARGDLISKYEFSKLQAQAILDLKLQRLTALEREKIVLELAELLIEIERLESILASESLLLELIKDELKEVREIFGDERRSELLAATDEISLEDLIADEQMVVTLTHSGYIKRHPLSEYRTQRRGGRGVVGMNTRDEDFVEKLFVASTHEYVLVFTNKGRLFILKVYQIPKAGRTALGRALINLIQLEKGEKPATVFPIRKFEEGLDVFFSTRKGIVKKTKLMAFSRMRSTGLIAIRLDEDDELIGVDITDGNKHILLATKQGKAIHFLEDKVRTMGRGARGVKGINLAEGDYIVSLIATELGADILTVTENGFGKRTLVDEYRLTKRGGKGVITIKCTERNGPVAGLIKLDGEDHEQLMFATNTGRVIRIPAKSVRQQGRNTQGVRLFRIDGKEIISSIASLIEENVEEELEENDLEAGSGEQGSEEIRSEETSESEEAASAETDIEKDSASTDSNSEEESSDS